MTEFTDKGLWSPCDEGECLYNLYCNMLEDDELCFTDAMGDALDKWHEHQAGCDKCEYI
jgi:hypothetical protein